MADPIVREHMTPNPITIDATISVAKAYRLMQEHGVRHLPVMNEGGLIGILTRSDILEAPPPDASRLNVFDLNYVLATVPVEDLMTPDPVTISPEATVLEAADLMFEHDIGSLPVVEQDQLIGIITETDIFHLVVRMLADHHADS